MHDVAIVSVKVNDATNIKKNPNLKELGYYYTFFTLYKNEWKKLLSQKQRSNFKQSKRELK